MAFGKEQEGGVAGATLTDGDTGESQKDSQDVLILRFGHYNCEDIEQTYNELSAKGCGVAPPEMMFYGGKEMQLTDPDGNLILFLS